MDGLHIEPSKTLNMKSFTNEATEISN